MRVGDKWRGPKGGTREVVAFKRDYDTEYHRGRAALGPCWMVQASSEAGCKTWHYLSWWQNWQGKSEKIAEGDGMPAPWDWPSTMQAW